jgi:phosphopantothenoylcysteine decarboxylase/phosphopantothenate--cysteine ligase
VAALKEAGSLHGKSVLVTAGPTREHFDPVRYLSNPSTGKMGLAIAEEARARGAEVTVVLGPVGKVESEGLEVISVTSADEMSAAVMQRLEGLDYFVAAAAVSDWKPAEKAEQKKKKSEGPEALTLVRTPDVLLDVSQRVRGTARRPVLVGFAAETEQVVDNAREKLSRKSLDFIVANDLTDPAAGFAVETNKVIVLDKAGASTAAEGTKREVAARIWDVVSAQG